MSSDETNYYRARSQAERALAKSSKDPVVAGIHEYMASLYDKLIVHEERARVVWASPSDRSQENEHATPRLVSSNYARN